MIKMTNREYINQMSNEELSNFLLSHRWIREIEYYTSSDRLTLDEEALPIWLEEEYDGWWN